MSPVAQTLLCAVCALSLAGCAAPVVKDFPEQQSQIKTIPRSGPKIVLYSTSWCPHCREAKEKQTEGSDDRHKNLFCIRCECDTRS